VPPVLSPVPFQAHLDLLHLFIARRQEIVERIQEVLNAQRRPVDYLQGGGPLARRLEDCFFALGGISASQSRLRGGLEDAHAAHGFKPRQMPGLHNGLVDPAEIVARAFHLWRQTHWPGRNGRIRYAHTLFNLTVIRQLALLSMRVWDAGAASAGERLRQVQGALDQLWTGTPDDQPVFVRDARWLIPLAQSPATDDLGAYFDVAEQVAEALPCDDRLEIHKAGARMAAGHLRSQIRYYATKNAAALDDEGLLRNTRTTNALDFALLIQDLVPLLEAYENACHDDDRPRRLELADAICQGLSPDPELFLNRVELLGAYGTIEHLFITTSGDGAALTPVGRRHLALVQEYEARTTRAARWLEEDCRHFRPVAGAYSPYGVLYGFSSDLIEHMALKATQPDAVPHFGLEEVFSAGDASKLAWVSGWRKLPHLTAQVQKLFEYPQQFAEDIFDRLERALRRRLSTEDAGAGVQTGRLLVAPGDPLPDIPRRYVTSSDPQIVAAGRAESCDEPHLLADRREGRCLLSYRTPGGWVAISKSILTDVLGAGRDARIGGLPAAAADALALMCPRLVRIDVTSRAPGSTSPPGC
jgi:hypothetical protein